MDFFGRQDIARKNSKILIFYYAIAVLAISSLIGLTVLFIRSWLLESEKIPHLEVDFFDLDVFLRGAGPVLILILLASFFKSLALSKGGGSMVAKSLGGREVDRSTNNHKERVLVNVVEEMVNMIETQRAYEVNSKSISATDGMLRFLNNNL